MKRFLFFFISLQSWFCFPQTPPAIAWQKLIGGNLDEAPYFTFDYKNGNLYLGASSNSNISGDKTQNRRGAYDYWVVKADENATITWDKTMGASAVVIGGPHNQLINSVYQTSDGSVLVGGFSNSSISYEKTEMSRGDYDYWVLKLAANGTILWDKTIGGDDFDSLTDFFEAGDGNYIVAGTSNSSNTGDKTDVSRGASDIWILKLNPSGTILWQKTIGGQGYDSLGKIIPTSDGGFIIASRSASPVSGEKTENSYGASDYWIIKLDTNGIIQWQKTIGGSNTDIPATIIPTSDGGYLVGGLSNSSTSGLKTEDSRGGNDYWVVKLDAIGTIQWQKTIGGNQDDGLFDISQCMDGSYIMTGSSRSNTSGDKTEDIKGEGDAWVVKLKDDGALQWQKDIGGIDDDWLSWVKQLPDASFILGGYSFSSNSFDVTATNHSIGFSDIWVVKLNAESLATSRFDNASLTIFILTLLKKRYT